MLQLKNSTSLACSVCVFPNPEGIESLYVIVKATFTLRPVLSVADQQVPPVLTDEHWGEPERSSIKYPGELHLSKPGTDVLLVGNAWAPGGRPVPEMMVALTVAERRKVVQVFGDRRWKGGIGGGFSEPEPFSSMPLVFERAFGGTNRRDDRVFAEQRNPVGAGFAEGRDTGEMTGQKLPNLEDPANLLGRRGDVVPPACFGVVAPAWLPRRLQAGTYDEAWQTRRAPYLPRDFDSRFLNCAAPELVFPRHLQGGEPLALLGASREGQLRFALPRVTPAVEVNVAGSVEHPPARLETVLLQPDENRMMLTWRAELPCDRRILKVREIKVAEA